MGATLCTGCVTSRLPAPQPARTEGSRVRRRLAGPRPTPCGLRPHRQPGPLRRPVATTSPARCRFCAATGRGRTVSRWCRRRRRLSRRRLRQRPVAARRRRRRRRRPRGSSPSIGRPRPTPARRRSGRLQGSSSTRPCASRAQPVLRRWRRRRSTVSRSARRPAHPRHSSRHSSPPPLLQLSRASRPPAAAARVSIPRPHLKPPVSRSVPRRKLRRPPPPSRRP